MLNANSIGHSSRARPVESPLRKFRQRGLENHRTSIDCALLLATFPLGWGTTTRRRRRSTNRAAVSGDLAVFHNHPIIPEFEGKDDSGCEYRSGAGGNPADAAVAQPN